MFEKISANILVVTKEAGKLFVPGRPTRKNKASLEVTKRTAVLIPTHGPTYETRQLITSILKYHKNVLVVVIDDCTPLTKANLFTINKIKELAASNKQLKLLRTPTNALKAGALNFGIDYLQTLSDMPEVIFTLDDDVKINEFTIPTMVESLYSDKKIGAVCSSVHVKNNDQNVLTRLQGLEYHSFNMTKISDNGFLKGPLVMQGMLTAFRMQAIKQINGYRHGHLIEDYDITARIKTKGWDVKMTREAIAWTTVPETLEQLWKQRVRWVSGGLHVVAEFWKKPIVIYQDLVGHALFISLFVLVMLSFLFSQGEAKNTQLAFTLLILSLVNFFIAFTFSIATLFNYSQRDRKDVAIKLLVLPELIYSNLLSLILIGSYLFYIYNKLPKNALTERGNTAFSKIGFSTTWGTKVKKGGAV